MLPERSCVWPGVNLHPAEPGWAGLRSPVEAAAAPPGPAPPPGPRPSETGAQNLRPLQPCAPRAGSGPAGGQCGDTRPWQEGPWGLLWGSHSRGVPRGGAEPPELWGCVSLPAARGEAAPPLPLGSPPAVLSPGLPRVPAGLRRCCHLGSRARAGNPLELGQALPGGAGWDWVGCIGMGMVPPRCLTAWGREEGTWGWWHLQQVAACPSAGLGAQLGAHHRG